MLTNEERLKILDNLLDLSPNISGHYHGYPQIDVELYNKNKELFRKLGIVSKGYRKRGERVAIGVGSRFSTQTFEDYVISELKHLFIENEMQFDDDKEVIFMKAIRYSAKYGTRAREIFNIYLRVVVGTTEDELRKQGFNVVQKDGKMLLWKEFGKGVFSILFKPHGFRNVSTMYIGRLDGKILSKEEKQKVLEDILMYDAIKDVKTPIVRIYFFGRGESPEDTLRLLNSKYELICQKYSELVKEVREFSKVLEKKGWKIIFDENKAWGDFKIINPKNGGKVSIFVRRFSDEIKYKKDERFNTIIDIEGRDEPIYELDEVAFDQCVKTIKAFTKVFSKDEPDPDEKDVTSFFISMLNRDISIQSFGAESMAKQAFTALNLGIKCKNFEIAEIPEEAIRKFLEKYGSLLKGSFAQKKLTNLIHKREIRITDEKMLEYLPSISAAMHILLNKEILDDTDLNMIEKGLTDCRSLEIKMKLHEEIIQRMMLEGEDGKLEDLVTKYVDAKANRLEAFKIMDLLKNYVDFRTPKNIPKNFIEHVFKKAFNIDDAKLVKYDAFEKSFLILDGRYLVSLGGDTIKIRPTDNLLKNCTVLFDYGEYVKRTGVKTLDLYLAKSIELLEETRKIYQNFLSEVGISVLKFIHISGASRPIVPNYTLYLPRYEQSDKHSLKEKFDELFERALEEIKQSLYKNLENQINQARKQKIPI